MVDAIRIYKTNVIQTNTPNPQKVHFIENACLHALARILLK
jgi:hypothetical protein